MKRNNSSGKFLEMSEHFFEKSPQDTNNVITRRKTVKTNVIKIKKGFPFFDSYNNFKKCGTKKTKKITSNRHKTHTEHTTRTEHSSKFKNKRSKGMKTR